MDCFHEGANFLAIDPDECIDCTLCVTECPADAIFPDDEVPDDQQNFFDINAELAPGWPVIDEKIDAPEDADDWNGTPGKLAYLDRAPPE